ncbi:MAG: hypothetical protein K2W95_15440 [Candidatus Obscuribacterales bacterium]|nr:hypothetical protein [Candidatus Obscuribacterales bacterium]
MSDMNDDDDLEALELELPDLPNVEATLTFIVAALQIMANELEDLTAEMAVLIKHDAQANAADVGEVAGKLELQCSKLHRLAGRELGRVQGVLPPVGPPPTPPTPLDSKRKPRPN